MIEMMETLECAVERRSVERRQGDRRMCERSADWNRVVDPSDRRTGERRDGERRSGERRQSVRSAESC